MVFNLFYSYLFILLLYSTDMTGVNSWSINYTSCSLSRQVVVLTTYYLVSQYVVLQHTKSDSFACTACLHFNNTHMLIDMQILERHATGDRI